MTMIYQASELQASKVGDGDETGGQQNCSATLIRHLPGQGILLPKSAQDASDSACHFHFEKSLRHAAGECTASSVSPRDKAWIKIHTHPFHQTRSKHITLTHFCTFSHFLQSTPFISLHNVGVAETDSTAHLPPISSYAAQAAFNIGTCRALLFWFFPNRNFHYDGQFLPVLVQLALT